MKHLNMHPSPSYHHFSLLHPNILHNTLSQTPSAYFLSSFNVKDQVSHPYKTTFKITVLCYFDLQVFREEMEIKKCMNRMVARQALIHN
jgi:hypothetical protein